MYSYYILAVTFYPAVVFGYGAIYWTYPDPIMIHAILIVEVEQGIAGQPEESSSDVILAMSYGSSRSCIAFAIVGYIDEGYIFVVVHRSYIVKDLLTHVA
jgi:hypothetical protein